MASARVWRRSWPTCLGYLYRFLIGTISFFPNMTGLILGNVVLRFFISFTVASGTTLAMITSEILLEARVYRNVWYRFWCVAVEKRFTMRFP